MFTPTIESTDFHALGLGDLNKFLEAGTSKWGPEGSGVVASDSGVDGAVYAVRHSWRRVHDVTEGEVERTFEFVEADYWLAAQNPNRIALLTFSTALADYESDMLELFDAIVRTIRWPASALILMEVSP